MGRGVAVAVILLGLGLALAPRGSSSAQSSANPLIFALGPWDFPPGSSVVDARVASNVDLGLYHLQIGPEFEEGRLTGYYMRGQKSDSAGTVGIVTSYLASIFTSPGQAALALAAQVRYWQGLSQSSPVGSVRELTLQSGQFGDPGTQRWYTATDANGHTHSELFFQRGPFFMELNIDGVNTQPDPSDLQAFLGMAGKLDNAAGAALGVFTPLPTVTGTPTPLPTATPTSTPRPTATPTRTRAPRVAGAVAHGPVREHRAPKCKTGYKLVRGSCKKVPRRKP
jgi:hypothetical protein